MTGIRDLFASFDGSDRDDFQLAFYFEREYEAKLERNRWSARWWWRRVKQDHAKHAAVKERTRKRVAAFEKRKRETDPQWVEAYRKRNRERMARKRAERTAGNG